MDPLHSENPLENENADESKISESASTSTIQAADLLATPIKTETESDIEKMDTSPPEATPWPEETTRE